MFISSRRSKFYFQQNTTMNQYQKHFVDISKLIETMLQLPMVTREAAGLMKLSSATITPANWSIMQGGVLGGVGGFSIKRLSSQHR